MNKIRLGNNTCNNKFLTKQGCKLLVNKICLKNNTCLIQNNECDS
jgi:hypothetical protein